MPNYNSQLQSNNTDLQTILQTLQTKAAGGSSGGGGGDKQIEYEIITIPAGATSVTYKLSRVTNAYGCITSQLIAMLEPDEDCNIAVGIFDNCVRCITYSSYDTWTRKIDVEMGSCTITFNDGVINFYGVTFLEPMNVLLINDPNISHALS